MTERRPTNSKWLTHCLNNSSLFHSLFSNSSFVNFSYVVEMCSIDFLSKSSKQIPKITPECKRKWSLWVSCYTVPHTGQGLYLVNATVFYPVLGFHFCQGQAGKQCQQWCQPCKTQKAPRANRKSQSAKSTPELTQAVLAINLLKCAYLYFYQLPPLLIHTFIFSSF